MVHSGRMLVVWATACRYKPQVRATMVAGQAVTRGEAGSLSRALNESGTVYNVCD